MVGLILELRLPAKNSFQNRSGLFSSNTCLFNDSFNNTQSLLSYKYTLKLVGNWVVMLTLNMVLEMPKVIY